MRPPSVVSLAFVCVLAAGSASAQVIQPPPRSSNGLFGGRRAALDPNRTGQELAANFNVLGSYEDNLTPPDQGVITDPYAERQSGTTGSVSGELRYRYGRATRSIESSGRGYVHSFRNVGVTPMYGGNADLFASTILRRRLTLGAGAYASHQPSFMLTSARLSDVVTAPADPTGGVLDLRSTNAAGTSTATYAWAPRQRTSVSYDYSQVRFTGDTLTNSKSHEVGVGHTWDLRRSVGLLWSYRLSELRATTSGEPTRPTKNQTATLGIELRKRLSRTRTLLFNGGGGAMHVRTLSEFDNRLFNYVTPSAFVGTRLDLGRTWAVAFDAHRDVSVLDAVTTQSFVNDLVSLQLGGRLATSWLLAFNGSWSQGKAHQGDVGSFEAGNGSAQVQYNLTRCCSVVGGYTFYTHRLRDVEAVPAGFPRRFERNAVSVGISIFLPLYGQFSGVGRD